MPTTHTIDLGVIQFMPIETFLDPTRGLDRDARVDKLVEDLVSDRPQSVGDWPRVRTAIRRGELFVVETSTPSFTATLRFDPEHPDAGDYETHRRPRGPVEKGRTIKVTAVAADETDSRLSILTPFAVRYAVRTVANDRPRTALMWLVGLKSYRPVAETTETDDGAA